MRDGARSGYLVLLSLSLRVRRSRRGCFGLCLCRLCDSSWFARRRGRRWRRGCIGGRDWLRRCRGRRRLSGTGPVAAGSAGGDQLLLALAQLSSVTRVGKKAQEGLDFIRSALFQQLSRQLAFRNEIAALVELSDLDLEPAFRGAAAPVIHGVPKHPDIADCPGIASLGQGREVFRPPPIPL